MKCEGSKSYRSKYMASVKVFETDGLKTICPRSITVGGIKKGHNSCKKCRVFFPLMVEVPLLTVYTCSSFQVNIISNSRDMSKFKVCQPMPTKTQTPMTFCSKTANLKKKLCAILYEKEATWICEKYRLMSAYPGSHGLKLFSF